MSLSAVTSSHMPRANIRCAQSPLTGLIAAMNAAAERFCALQQISEEAEQKVKAATPAIPGVFCSMIEETTIVVKGETTTFPSRPCYYKTEDSIERDNSLTPAQRAEKRSELLRQIAEAESMVPASLRNAFSVAKKEANAASAAFDRAEAAVARFKPTTGAEAAELLEIIANPRVNTFNTDQERAVLKTVAKALRSGGLR